MRRLFDGDRCENGDEGWPVLALPREDGRAARRAHFSRRRTVPSGTGNDERFRRWRGLRVVQGTVFVPRRAPRTSSAATLRARGRSTTRRCRRFLRRWLDCGFSSKASLRRATAHPDQVQCDSAQPWLERTSVRRRVLGRDQPGLLNEIIGVAFVANQSAGEALQPRQFGHQRLQLGLSADVLHCARPRMPP